MAFLSLPAEVLGSTGPPLAEAAPEAIVAGVGGGTLVGGAKALAPRPGGPVDGDGADGAGGPVDGDGVDGAGGGPVDGDGADWAGWVAAGGGGGPAELLGPSG